MAEPGSRTPADNFTAQENQARLVREGLGDVKGLNAAANFREELKAKGLKGFKKGGKVKETGVYKLHKGEKVLTRRQALYGEGN